MSLGTVVTLLRTAIFQVVTIAGPTLLVAMVIGLLISIFQATTSIQDQSLTFVPKIVAILATIGILGGWMISMMQNYTVNLYSLIPDLSR
ncbi:MAG: flagellar biosynthesis protein FliQ [Spirochaetaceae bacterium]|jgi:flagellar biosynthetic protein FliQ|nr:flagellar biosynthesis protein FliQ [Spirochaetaceae bacterium]